MSQLRPTITVDTSQWEGFDRSSFAFEKEDVQPRASVAERQSVDRKWGKAVALPKLQEFQARIIREVLERTPGTLPGPSSCHSTWASRARALMERNGAVQASSISGARVPGKKELAESPFGRMRLENRQAPAMPARAAMGSALYSAGSHAGDDVGLGEPLSSRPSAPTDFARVRKESMARKGDGRGARLVL